MKHGMENTTRYKSNIDRDLYLAKSIHAVGLMFERIVPVGGVRKVFNAI
jgi:hypothetical protein